MTLSNFTFDTLAEKVIGEHNRDPEFLPTVEWVGSAYEECDYEENEWERLSDQDRDQVVQELLEELENTLIDRADRLSFNFYAYR